jgi:hypothetical protein
VPAAAQKRALAALTSALAPDELLLPARLLPLIAVDDQEAHALVRRTGEGRAGPVFDETALVRGLASTLVSALLNGARAVRMINQRARDAAQPGFDAVIDGLTGAAPVAAALGEGPAAHATRIVQAATVEGLLALGRSPQSTRDVRGIATAKLKTLRARYAATQPAASFAYRAHAASLVDDIGRFLERREAEPAATGRGTVTVETDPVIDDGLEAPRCGSYR